MLSAFLVYAPQVVTLVLVVTATDWETTCLREHYCCLMEMLVQLNSDPVKRNQTIPDYRAVGRKSLWVLALTSSRVRLWVLTFLAQVVLCCC